MQTSNFTSLIVDLSGFTVPVVVVWETANPHKAKAFSPETGKKSFYDCDFFLEKCADEKKTFEYYNWEDLNGSTAISEGRIQMAFLKLPIEQIAIFTPILLPK